MGKQKFGFVCVIVTIAMFFLALFGVFVSKANDDRVTQDDFLEQYNSLVERYNLDVNNGIKIGSSSSNVELSNDDKVYQSMRLIVKSKSETLPSMGANEVISGYNNLHIYQFDSIENTKKAHIELEKLSNVDYVDIDIKFEISDSSISGYDDDFSYSTWGYDDMGIDVYSQMLKSKYPEQMEQVVVAVMDTGIDTDHSWFKDRIYDGGRNFSSTNSWDINNYEDGHGHGTHVSGTIVDLTLSNVQILPIKVMDDGGNGYLYQILNGIEYVIGLKEDGVNIVAMNFSIGGYCYETTDYDSYNELLTKAYNLGMLSVVASGNNGDDVDNYIPAKVEKAITVAAIGSESSGSYYSPAWSNYGSTVDVCAPGVNIVSASIDGETVSNQGTSMATPHVTAVVALLSSDTESNLDVAQITSVINNSAIDLGSIGWDKYYGYGLVNITYGSIEKLPDVTFSREDGECSEQFQLTLTINNNDSTPNTDAVIFYTLDGSEPSTDSTKYTSPITINETTIVKAVAYELDSRGTITAFGRVKTITYYFYGQDLESAFVVSDDGVLSKYNGVLQDIIVPETINSITIVEIGSEAFLGKNIISISLPNTIKTIGSSAFENCSYLERIYAPGVVDIDGFAFNGCASLLYVDNDHFPALVNIGMAAFQNCKSINSIELDYVEVVEGYAFNYCNSKSLINVHLENVEIIGDYAFHRCIYIEKINMPKVVKVSTSAFEDNSLTIINLPNLEYLGNSAFRGNDYIGTVALPECKVIGSWTFYECRNLKNLEIPKAEYIHYGAFAYCNSIEELSLPKAKEIHSSAFVELIYITELYLPETEYIGFGAFENCLSVLEIELPKVERIEKYAFAGLSSLETVILSSVINSIDNDAFYDCNSDCVFGINSNTIAKEYMIENGYNYNIIDNVNYLSYSIENNEVMITGYNNLINEEIVIPAYIDGYPVTTIVSGALQDCEYIYSLNVPTLISIENDALKNCSNLVDVKCNQLQSIGSYAFSGCGSLEEIEIESVEVISEYAFYNCTRLSSMLLPDTLKSIGEKAIGYYLDESDSIVIDGFAIKGYSGNEAETYAQDNDIQFLSRFNNLTRYYYNFRDDGKSIYIAEVEDWMSGSLIFPSEYQPSGYDSPLPIVEIGVEALSDCSFITDIILPNSIVELGDRAFAGCVSLKTINLDYITSMGESCFQYCTSLEEVKIDNIEVVSYRAFTYCYNLKNISIANATIIEEFAFDNCYNLESVYGDKITTIEYYAFCNAYQLREINTMNVTTLGSRGSVFKNCDSLETIFLPKIKIIYAEVFLNSNIDYVVIGNTLEYIGINAIDYDCTIVGYTDSLAQEYATYYNIDFIEITDFEISEDLVGKVSLTLNSERKLSVLAGGYSQSYQWYCSDSNSYDGEIIAGANDSSYRLDTDTVGAKYYYVKIVNWDRSILYSNICYVEVIDGFVIKSSFSGQGSMSLVGENIVERYNNIRYTFTPNEGYYIKQIIVDGEILEGEQFSSAINQGYTFYSVSSEHTISVTFASIMFNISIECSDGGRVNNIGNNTIKYGEDFIVKITPDEGYLIKSVVIDGEDKGVISTYQFSDIISDHNVVVVFEIMKFTISISANDGGNIDLSKSGQISYGDNVTVYLTPHQGYGLKKILVNGLEQQRLNQFDIMNIVEDISVVVEFGKLYNIVASVASGGSITPTSSVVQGENYTINIVPDAGYKIKEVFIDGESKGSISSYVFEGVSSEHTISAIFEIMTFTITVSTKGNGEIVTKDNLNNIEYGSDITFSILPDEEWVVDSVKVNGQEVEIVDNKLTLIDVSEDTVINVLFVEKSAKTIMGLGKIEFIGVVTGLILFAIMLSMLILKRKSKNRE